MEQTPSKKMNGRTKAGLWLLIAPTATIILSFVAFAVVNWIASTTTPAPAGDTLFNETPMWSTIVNVILYIVGVVGVISWLPGLIVGIVLLATKK